MISPAGLSIGELAAYVADHLRRKGIDVVLVGAAATLHPTIYSPRTT